MLAPSTTIMADNWITQTTRYTNFAIFKNGGQVLVGFVIILPPGPDVSSSFILDQKNISATLEPVFLDETIFFGCQNKELV